MVEQERTLDYSNKRIVIEEFQKPLLRLPTPLQGIRSAQRNQKNIAS